MFRIVFGTVVSGSAEHDSAEHNRGVRRGLGW